MAEIHANESAHKNLTSHFQIELQRTDVSYMCSH